MLDKTCSIKVIDMHENLPSNSRISCSRVAENLLSAGRLQKRLQVASRQITFFLFIELNLEQIKYCYRCRLHFFPADCSFSGLRMWIYCSRDVNSRVKRSVNDTILNLLQLTFFDFHPRIQSSSSKDEGPDRGRNLIQAGFFSTRDVLYQESGETSRRKRPISTSWQTAIRWASCRWKNIHIFHDSPEKFNRVTRKYSVSQTNVCQRV